MAFDGVLVRFGEIGIKSPPVRRAMLRRLRENLLDAFLREGIEGDAVVRGPRLWLAGPDVRALVDAATRVFGVVSVSPCLEVPATLDEMGDAAVALSRERTWSSFAVRPAREGKHGFTSPDIGREVGSAVFRAAEAAGRQPRVDLGDPDLEVFVDVRGDTAYVFLDKEQGPGGLPLGSQGSVALLLSEGDSCLAGWLMMRRGCTVLPVHAGDTGSVPLEGVEALQRWGMGSDVEVLPVCSGSTAKEVLLEAAWNIGKESGCSAVVTGETLSSPLVAVPGVPVLRPLCGLLPSEADHWRDVAGIPDLEAAGLFSEDATETVDSLLRMRRTVQV